MLSINKYKNKNKNKKKNYNYNQNYNYKIISATAHISSTFNNTIITFSSNSGDIISWSTSSSMGFKGKKKTSTYSSQLAGEKAARKAMKRGIKDIKILIKGPGIGRDFAIRGILNSGIKVSSIEDITPLPHNGCKAPKVRRK